MPRRELSKSYSRSPKRNKRYRNSSDSDRDSSRRKSKNDRGPREDSPAERVVYNINEKSDLKHHVRYNNIRIRHREDKDFIMEEVKSVLEKEFGKIAQINKIEQTDNSLSFGVGFKYDKDAMHFVKECGYINSKLDNIKLEAVPTATFQECIPMIKEAKRIQKEKEKENEKEKEKARSRSFSKVYRRHSYSSEKQKKKRSRSPYSRSRENKHKRSRSKSSHRKRSDEKTVWMFGLPWSIKGKEVGEYLLHRHPSGPFHVNNWRWVRLKNSNCEFMELTLEAKKAEKLLSLKDEPLVQGCSCIITNSNGYSNEDSVRQVLRQYQVRLHFPEKVYPENVVRAMREVCGVVQVVSCSRLVEGRSDSYVVTLANAAKAKELKRLNLRQAKITIEDSKGQLVYRPTKSSKLTDSS